MGRRKTEAAWFGSPCACQTCPSVILREICSISRVSPLRGDTLVHVWQHGPLGDTATAPLRKSKPAQQSLRLPLWRVSLQWLTPLFAPREAGPGLWACWRWHAGSARMLSEQRARPCQLPLCLGAAQQDACPCTDASGTPARKANAGGSGKEELRSGPQPTSERLEAPHSQCQLTSRQGLGAAARSRGHQAVPAAAARLCSLVLDLGPFGF